MAFRLAGGDTPPEWVLAESRLLSRIPADDLEALAKVCGRQAASRDGKSQPGAVQGESVRSLMIRNGVEDDSDGRALLATLNYIIVNAAKYNVEPAALCHEVSQLGLSPERVNALVRAVDSVFDRVRARLTQQSLRCDRPSDTHSLRWSVVASVSSREAVHDTFTSVEVEIPVRGPRGERLIAFEASESKFRLLAAELERARAVTLASSRILAGDCD